MKIRKRCKIRTDNRRWQLFWTTQEERYRVAKTRVEVETLQNYRTKRYRKIITHRSELHLTKLGKMYNFSCMVTDDTPLPEIFRWSFTNVLKHR
ncbi:hypothetical protein [Vibrio phage PJN101]|nr:hypothetical protein [Vibrio phage PJN101]